VDVVLFAVELLQIGLEVGADLPHDLFCAGQHDAGERIAPVLRDKNQVNVQVVDNMATGSDTGIRVPAW
jgi:4-diphosphocytidyl-2C-methyl-D-erythritol kinase